MAAEEPASTAHADKIYIVTRADLSAGYQTTQVAHALADFLLAHADIAATWAALSNSLICLTLTDEAGLHTLHQQVEAAGTPRTLFREPDLCDEATALAIGPDPDNRRRLANLPLAGKPHPDPAGLRAREQRLRHLSTAMQACEQTRGQDVLAHGRSVREHYRALLAHLHGHIDLSEYDNWRLPGWLTRYGPQLLAAQAPYPAVDRYLTVHDCGKPAALVIDEDGRRHFPRHWQVSAKTYTETYADTADPLVADLIEHDSDIHQLKALDVPAFAANPNAATHLLTGLAEITSNAAMFGGLDSTSFKIKYKTLTSRGNALCAVLFDQPPGGLA